MNGAAFNIDAALPGDAAAVAQIHVDAWRSAYVGIVPDTHLASLSVDTRTAMWREAIERGTPQVLVARTDDGLAGWIAFGPTRDEAAAPGSGEVWALYVAPTHWRAGCGRQLLQRACAGLAERGHAAAMLWVLVDNADAIRFYEAAGFVADAGSDRLFTLAGREIGERRYRHAL